MKNLILTAVFSAFHIIIFMIAHEYLGMRNEANFLLFWAMLGLTWGAGIHAEATRK